MFRLGQHVMLVSEPVPGVYTDGGPGQEPVQFNDRFTVLQILTEGCARLLSHKSGEEHIFHCPHLRPVVYNPEPAGVPRGSFNTLQALNTVVQHSWPDAMQDVLLDLERARMEREDFRQGMGPGQMRPDSSITMYQNYRGVLTACADCEQALSDIRDMAIGHLAVQADELAEYVVDRADDVLPPIDSDDESRSSAEEQSVA